MPGSSASSATTPGATATGRPGRTTPPPVPLPARRASRKLSRPGSSTMTGRPQSGPLLCGHCCSSVSRSRPGMPAPPKWHETAVAPRLEPGACRQPGIRLMALRSVCGADRAEPRAASGTTGADRHPRRARRAEKTGSVSGPVRLRHCCSAWLASYGPSSSHSVAPCTSHRLMATNPPWRRPYGDSIVGLVSTSVDWSTIASPHFRHAWRMRSATASARTWSRP